ncbi:MAG: tetratricopeptide repeat protein [Pirellulales bacterium]
MADILETLQAGLDHHRAGRLTEAEKFYRRVLEIHPRHAGAAHLLGLIAFQVGRHDLALQCVEKAVEFDAFHAPYRVDLGEIYRALHQLPEAIASYRKAIELNPKIASAHTRLGTLLESTGHRAEALESYRNAVALDPASAEAHAALGFALLAEGQLPQSQASLEKAAQLAPDNAEVYFRLGRCLHVQNKLLDAIACYQKVARLQADSHAAHYQLGCAYQARGQLDHAATHYTKALELAPRLAEAHYNLAIVRRDQGRPQEALIGFKNALECDSDMVDAHLSLANLYMTNEQPDEAATAARRASELRPESASAAAHLARALQLQGDMQGSIAAFRRIVELDPGDAAAHSNWIYALNADPAVDAQALAAEHRAWAERHAEPLTAAARPHSRDRTPEKRLRIGYLSPHFREHAVSFFSLPLLAAHDHGAFEVFCYADSNLSDQITERFRQSADHWRPIAGLTDSAAADLVREDAVDILVDLAGHIGENRLLIFARKPAPIQVTYLGYQNTTGMSAMDYRLSDAHADPPGTDAFYSEKLVRLPRSFFCYAPPEPSPEVNPLPALEAGGVTFGWLNSMMKMTPEAIRTWAKILTAVPGSRLIVLAYRPGVFEQRVREAMTRFEVDPARVEIVRWCGQDEYLRLHHRIDLALDSFPLNGHTTVSNALWMGVPSVVREGTTYASRFGGTALINLGLDDLIARSSDDYVRIASGLAGDLPRLAEMRCGLRARMSASPLMDAAGFARYVEHGYRQMWRAWCRRA